MLPPAVLTIPVCLVVESRRIGNRWCEAPPFRGIYDRLVAFLLLDACLRGRRTVRLSVADLLGLIGRLRHRGTDPDTRHGGRSRELARDALGRLAHWRPVFHCGSLKVAPIADGRFDGRILTIHFDANADSLRHFGVPVPWFVLRPAFRRGPLAVDLTVFAIWRWRHVRAVGRPVGIRWRRLAGQLRLTRRADRLADRVRAALAAMEQEARVVPLRVEGGRLWIDPVTLRRPSRRAPFHRRRRPVTKRAVESIRTLVASSDMRAKPTIRPPTIPPPSSGPPSTRHDEPPPVPSDVEEAVDGIDHDGLADALRRLGSALRASR